MSKSKNAAHYAWVDIPKEAQQLIVAAGDAAKNAYAPYSHFYVGSAAETSDGNVFVGANMENASYGLTICAEVGALQSASTAGRLADISRIAIVGGLESAGAPSKGRATMPCGRCRQLILEAAQISRRDIEVWCADRGLSTFVKTSASDLLPLSFDSTDLSANGSAET